MSFNYLPTDLLHIIYLCIEDACDILALQNTCKTQFSIAKFLEKCPDKLMDVLILSMYDETLHTTGLFLHRYKKSINLGELGGRLVEIKKSCTNAPNVISLNVEFIPTSENYMRFNHPCGVYVDPVLACKETNNELRISHHRGVYTTQIVNIKEVPDKNLRYINFPSLFFASSFL